MVALFAGCKRSEIKVIPKNWKTAKASIREPWQIYYRFYDPALKGTKLWGKLIQIKGMNDCHTLEERQVVTKALLEDEKESLDVCGKNPITGQPMVDQSRSAGIGPDTGGQDISPDTPYIQALRFALAHIDIEPHTREDINSVLKYYEKSAMQLNKYRRPLKEIKRRDIVAILDNCKNLEVSAIKKGITVVRKKIWTSNQFNHYRKYLHILYAYLEKEEVIEFNPVEKIDKKDIARDEDGGRQILTIDERRRIDVYLRSKPNLATFHRFLNIFFHSGARIVELVNLQGKHVDLAGQRFKVLVKKGNGRHRWVWKTIKDVALPFWHAAMQGCGENDFMFSVGLRPGARPIRGEQLTRRWNRHVKNTLGIKADLYALKHLHTTEVIDILEADQPAEATAIAAAHNSHTSEGMVVNIYDRRRQQRNHNKIKGIGNSLAGGS